MDREEKIRIVRNDLTQIGVPPIFDELLEEGGGSYIAGDNITIEDNVISAIVPDISDLATKEEVNAKQDALTAGDNITIEDNIISASGSISNVILVRDNGFYVVDSNLNIGFYVNNTGAHSANIVEYEEIN